MSETLAAALQLSLTSLVVTFVALGLFALIILTLRAAFSERSEPDQARPRTVPDPPDEELAAAIGLALHLSAAGSGSPAGNLGQALERGPGPYWVGGRAQGTSPSWEAR